MILDKNITKKMLEEQINELSSLGFTAILGAEIEFYSTSILKNLQDDFKYLPCSIISESGKNQFEAVIHHSENIFSTIDILELIKDKLNLKANFTAKPFEKEPGNALHIHINLLDQYKSNLFSKNNSYESLELLHSISGICNSMEECTLLFAPYQAAYQRYKGESIQSPNKICWGYNNRSAALRIPNSLNESRRIEHRVACADSSSLEVICAIFYGIIKGLKEKKLPPDPIYGNAQLEQYDMALLPQSLDVAKEKFFNGSFYKMFLRT